MTPRSSPRSLRAVPTADLVILYRSDLSSPEIVAAHELQKYLTALTGHTPPLLDEATLPGQPGAPAVLSVGRTRLSAEMIASGAIDEPRQRHSEAYLVRSLAKDNQTVVIFLGGSGIATLYAVYHYLEQYCEVGFFWDGDHVPQRSTVPVGGISIDTQPFFRDRLYFNPCLWYYTVPWWHWEEWQRYIDWMLKRRFNILDVSFSPGLNALWEKVWAKFGVTLAETSWSGPPYDLAGASTYAPIKPPSSAAWREGRAALHRQIVDYARARGLRIVGPKFDGAVPPEFRQVYLDAPLLPAVWAGFPPHYYLDPTSALYRAVGEAFLEAYIAEYGTDHLYHLANLGELALDVPAESKRQFRLRLPEANLALVRAVDPQGQGILPAWTFLGKEWPPAEVRQSLEALPADQVYILDFWAEQVPLYREHHSFYGRPWYFGVFHAFGGDTHLHGNMPLLERRLKTLATDQQAKGCVGFALVTEISGHNYFYYEFACKLGWNPLEVDLTAFTREYAARRYGEAAAEPMQRTLVALLTGVYGVDTVPRPLYWRRLSARVGADIAESPYHLGPLRRALEAALQAAPAAANDSHYLHDLNDLARHYTALLFNTAVLSMISAYRKLDSEAFERAAKMAELYLKTIEDLLSLDDYYWLSPILQAARTLPGAPADIDQRVRDVLTLWDGRIRDYASRDLYELVHGYYRPRVMAYIQELRRRLANGQCLLNYQPGEVRLEQQYDEIEHRWVSAGTPAPMRSNPPAVVEIVRRLLRELPMVDLPMTAAVQLPVR